MKECPKECGKCCYNVPMEPTFVELHKDKIVNEIIDWIIDVGMQVPVTCYAIENNKCPFLTRDCRCNIYHVRPEICRLFGSGKVKHKFLYCKIINQ